MIAHAGIGMTLAMLIGIAAVALCVFGSYIEKLPKCRKASASIA
jgi:hypothetical protein